MFDKETDSVPEAPAKRRGRRDVEAHDDRTPGEISAELIKARAAGGRVKVRATRPGYVNEQRYREGDVFFVAPVDFSDADDPKVNGWMSKDVPPDAPEKITTGQQALRKESAAISADKAAAGPATGDKHPLGSH